MNLEQRISLMVRLGEYMTAHEDEWLAAKAKASAQNPWFIPEFIDLAVTNIARNYLRRDHLSTLTTRYGVSENNPAPLKIGIVMAGNIPLVGFHDFLCVFLSGHLSVIKPSSKDDVLIRHLVSKLSYWEPAVGTLVTISEMIPNCDAYIATGSNNTSRYFEYYFKKYPSIIRRNRTSVAILTGDETEEELGQLADDVYLYFGLGCRNVTKIFVPKDYDFVPLLNAFRKYDHLINHHKYKNNYDYNLAVHMLNNQFYMTNGSILLVENSSVFSPISQLHYEYYTDEQDIKNRLKGNADIQCTVGKSSTLFGAAQIPGICDYADGLDTMEFLLKLSKNESFKGV